MTRPTTILLSAFLGFLLGGSLATAVIVWSTDGDKVRCAPQGDEGR